MAETTGVVFEEFPGGEWSGLETGFVGWVEALRTHRATAQGYQEVRCEMRSLRVESMLPTLTL